VILIALLLSRCPRRVALVASPLLLPSLFNTANSIENFATATGRTTRVGGSSYASSSRAAGKAPTSQHYAKTGDSQSAPLINLLTIKPATHVAQAI
jgi:hypothetical protein